MVQLGQSSNTNGPKYHRNGLPLQSGLIEMVTDATSQPEGRHAGLPVGELVIKGWSGQLTNPATQVGEVRWIEAADWAPYQKKTFVTPAFPDCGAAFMCQFAFWDIELCNTDFALKTVPPSGLFSRQAFPGL